jgi:hypothetical protein
MSKDDAAVEEAEAQEPAVQETAPVETNSLDSGADAQVTDPESDDFFDDIDAQVAEGNKEAEPEKEEATPEDTQGQSRGEDGKFIKTEQAEEVPPEAKTEKSVNRFQQLANERNQFKELAEQREAEIAKLKSQETQFATEQELLNEVNPETGEYYTPQEVERLAFAQSREQQAQSVSQQRYQLEVQQSQQTLASEAEQALSEFPIFDDKSPDYNPALTAQADELLKQSLVFDQNGTLIGSNLSPYKLYKSLADATKANAPVYQAQAQKSVERMTANADVGSGASQATKTKVDPMMEAFDAEASIR